MQGVFQVPWFCLFFDVNLWLKQRSFSINKVDQQRINKVEINKAPFNFSESPLVQKLMRHNGPSLKIREFKLMAAPNSTIGKYSPASLRLMSLNSKDFA